jgi:DNA-binding transcriptional MerR regulator
MRIKPGQQLRLMPDTAPDIGVNIPAKRYFTIGEVSRLCSLKSHVLRYWEQEFPQLQPNKRRGNRRYYQRHDVELICQIRHLLYDQGFTIDGARQQLSQQTGQPATAATPVSNTQIAQLREQITAIRQLLDTPIMTPEPVPHQHKIVTC